ncbi:MAG: DNA alkylation repair protein [Bacteroidaceae bacterium]
MEELKTQAEPRYRDFCTALCPGAHRPMLGVRLPLLRKMARTIAFGTEWRKVVDEELTNSTFEEVLLSGMIVGYAKMDLQESFDRIANYVKKIDNWSLCDSACVSFTIARKKPDDFWAFLQPYIDQDEEFRQRFGVVMLLDHFLTPIYIERVVKKLCTLRPTAYYAQMAVAWALSVCFIKRPDLTLSALQHTTLDTFTYNKTLQKILESQRTPLELRTAIRAMKR